MTTRSWHAALGIPIAIACAAGTNADPGAVETAASAVQEVRGQVMREWSRQNAATYGDLNNDGVVDMDDLNILIGNVGEEGVLLNGDLNGDSVINREDIRELFTNFGEDLDSSRVLRTLDQLSLQSRHGDHHRWRRLQRPSDRGQRNAAGQPLDREERFAPEPFSVGQQDVGAPTTTA